MSNPIAFFQGYNSKILEYNEIKKEYVNLSLTPGQVLFSIRDTQSADGSVSGIDTEKGGYIYLDYQYDSTHSYRLPMTAPYSDTAGQDSYSLRYLYQALDFFQIKQQADNGSKLEDNYTTLYFEPFQGKEAARLFVINYYPADDGWAWSTTGSNTQLSYLLKGVNRTITIPTIPAATSTTAGIVTAMDQIFGGNKTFEADTITISSDTLVDTTDMDIAALICTGGVLFKQNLRIDGNWILLNDRTVKIECDTEKSAINFVFL